MAPTRFAIAAALAFLLGATSASAATRTCEPVVFEQNSDNGTTRITAVNVSCKTARAVARKSNGRGPTGTAGTRRSYKSRGFLCRGIEIDEGLPMMRWTCKRGNARIRFNKG